MKMLVTVMHCPLHSGIPAAEKIGTWAQAEVTTEENDVCTEEKVLALSLVVRFLNLRV